MNERDSEQVAQMFIQGGYTLSNEESEADVILMNTCSIREKAELKALGKMGILTSRTNVKPHVVYGFMGCMAQSKGDELFKLVPGVDVVIGTQKYHHVFKYVDDILRSRMEFRMDDLSVALTGQNVCDTEEELGSQNAIRDHLERKLRPSAFISIMQGCEMRCAYCIVPSTRGAERSRPAEEILEEARGLVAQGTKEITLLGQIVNRYGREEPIIDGKSAFVRLLDALSELEGLERIRFMSPHPMGFRADLVEAFRRLPKLCSHIHFPMQSGSDRILKSMRRPYKNETYIKLCQQIREARPDIAITTDIIVGYPGESEEDFLQTCAAVELLEFDNAFIFQYSPRKNTPAAMMEDQISLVEKEARNQRLLGIVNRIAIAKNDASVGTIQDVLVEGPSKTNPNRLTGRTSQNKPVMLEGGSALIGKILPLRITESTGFTLYGSL